MEWKETGQIHQELEDIQIVASFKYDDYQQYTHGQRYVEKLSLWLRNFENAEERRMIYDFIKDNLVFISEEEMRQLISVSFDMYMKPHLLEKTKKFCLANLVEDENERKKVWKFFRRSALFLGLSDGAHMDYFRRHNSKLNNEQVFVHYDFSVDRAKEMLDELEQSTDYITMKRTYDSQINKKFNTIFLLDDFSGSGKSYIRFDKNKECWKGKIVSFIRLLEELSWDTDNVDIRVILYIATSKAIEEIEKNIAEFKQNTGCRINIDIKAVQNINKVELNQDMFRLFENNYKNVKKRLKDKGKSDYVDEHYQKGDIRYPFLGFDACSLAVVLYHNTPNNSFPVIWFDGGNDAALFPRVTRHKEG